MRYLLTLALALLCSCQARETTLALQMSDQAQEAAQRKVSTDLSATVVHLPEAMQAQQRQLIDEILLLLAASRDSIRPALALTQGNEPAPETKTTAEQAYQQPREFARQSAIQTGRAHAETEDYLGYLRAGAVIAQYGQALAGDIVSQLLLLLGGAGVAGGVGVKVSQVYRQLRATKEALKDAVSFGTDMTSATTKEQIEGVKEKHKHIQSRSGTKDLIKQTLGKT